MMTQKALFFMDKLRITAGEEYKTHKGTYALDFGGDDGGSSPIYAPFDLVIKRIDKAANTVFFESVHPVETPTFTDHVCGRFAHCNDADMYGNCKVGATIPQGTAFYKEGGKGSGVNGKFATHVHCVFARGLLKGNGWYNVGNGNFAMLSTGGKQHIYDVLYVPDDVPIVKTNDYKDKYPWKRIERSETYMDFIDGYQVLGWCGQRVHVYKQSGREKLGLISLPYGSVADITQFKAPGKKIKAILNCHYFNNHTDQREYGAYYGRCQSFTVDERTLGIEDEGFDGYKGTNDKPYMDFVVLKDGTCECGDFNSWDYPKEAVQVGFSPAAVQLFHGEIVNKYSPECGYGKVTTANTQSLLVRCSDGHFALVAVSGNLNLFQCRDFSRAYGCTDQAALDSGGSTQMLVNGSKKVYTGRKIPTCLVIYEDLEEPKPEPTPEEKPEVKPEGKPQPESPKEPARERFIHVDKVGLYVRKSLSFRNSRADGEILSFIPVGEKAKLLRFLPGLKPDGYQWVETEHNGITGYSQYDSSCYWIEE